MSQTGWGVILDVDGVLVDSGEAHYRSWRSLGQSRGRPFDRRLFDRTFGMHNAQIIPLWLGCDLPPRELDTLSQRKEELYRRYARRGHMKPLPGAAEMLAKLSQAGVAVALGTSGPKANADLALEILKAGSLVTAIASAEDVRRGKPDPEVFLVAARRLNLRPDHLSVIEDAPMGIEAARNANMTAIGISTTRSEAVLKEAGAHRVFRNLDGLTVDDLRPID